MQDGDADFAGWVDFEWRLEGDLEGGRIREEGLLTVWVKDFGFEFHFRGEVWVFGGEGEVCAEEAACFFERGWELAEFFVGCGVWGGGWGLECVCVCMRFLRLR